MKNNAHERYLYYRTMERELTRHSQKLEKIITKLIDEAQEQMRCFKSHDHAHAGKVRENFHERLERYEHAMRRCIQSYQNNQKELKERLVSVRRLRDHYKEKSHENEF